MLTFIKQIETTLQSQLALAHDEQDPLVRLKLAIPALDTALLGLKEYVIPHKFSDKAEEMDFFKRTKPAIAGIKIAETMRYNIIMNRPVATNETLLAYYEEELAAIQHFFRSNAFHYHYFKYGATELDPQYFLRDAPPLQVPLIDAPAPEPGFSTPVDALFAKFIACIKMQYELISWIAPLRYPQITTVANPSDSGLKWTGDSINLVELAYGIYLTGQLNDGNASLTRITKWLEDNLHVSIGRPHRRFNEIERRKRLSQTKFLDHMREVVSMKIEDANR